MKGRSHRLPVPTAPMDDWLDGSWTVDCPCGVTYDDGKEMVKCDECGVWVHTRCTRFVKEEASFTCDKCKARKPRPPPPSRVDSPAATNIEETEVAQLLAELPTKADPPPPPPPAYQRPAFRRWAERPMEEKVHVQGVPGGDPALFAGLSTIFSRELWKCTGYVPKKFNFKYKEFPCWEDDDEESPGSTGADLLFSLSKEGIAAVAAEAAERVPSQKGLKSRDGKGIFSGSGNKFMKKERSKLRGPGLYSTKRKDEDVVGSKNKVVKKIKISASGEKNKGSASRVDGSDIGKIEKEIVRDLHSELENVKREDKRVDKLSGSAGDLMSEGKQINDDLKNGSSAKSSIGVLVTAASKHKSPPPNADVKHKSPPPNADVKAEKIQVEDPNCNGILSRIDESAKSSGNADLIAELSEKEDAGTDASKQPDDISCDHLKLNGVSSNTEVETRQLETSTGDFGSASCVSPSSTILESTNASNEPTEPKNKDQVLSDFEQADENPALQTSVAGESEMKNLLLEHVQRPGGPLPIDLQNNEMQNDLSNDMCKLQVVESEYVKQPTNDSVTGVVFVPSDSRKLVPGQDSTGKQDPSLELQHAKISDREKAKLGSMSPENLATGGHKPALATGKPALTSNAEDVSRIPMSDSYKSPGTTSSSPAARTDPFHKHVKVNSSSISSKETAVNGLAVEGNIHGGMSRQLKGSATPGEKSSQANKTASAQASKHKSMDSKENMPCPSKMSSAENSACSSGSGRLVGPSQIQSNYMQAKPASSDPVTKNTRMTSLGSQPPNRVVNHSTAMHPPIPPSVVNTSTTLSDEELAKRLHHELNSSPRVSRGPRGLHASGSHFSSSTFSSMLSRRSSSASSGGKVQVLVSRRKNKEDAGKEAPHSREMADKAEKLEDLSSHRRQPESFYVNYSMEDVHKAPHDSLPSAKESGQLASVAGLAIRTLPGLIDEIMNEGRHMTYEELCDAVLPHWPNLRKPNGEQYTYSSHSLAVLDCLRNTNEWAHLVDYEPKTYTSKKRSKSNMTPSTGASEDGKADSAVSMGRDDRNGDSCHEHLPTKGKRLARKRRKLMLQGRAVQVTREREIGDAASEDDLGSFSGEEGSQSLSSKDEIQGSRRHTYSSCLTASSDEESD